MLQGSKVTRKRTARACVRPCKRNKTTEQSTHNEIDSILQEYQEKAQDMNPDSSATSVWLALNVVQYEETFMRECIYEEDKPCSMGQYCECNFIDVRRSLNQSKKGPDKKLVRRNFQGARRPSKFCPST